MIRALLERSITGNNDKVEDALAAQIIEKIDAGTERSAAERRYLREKLQAMKMPDNTEYIPAPLRDLSAFQRFELERKL